MTAHWQHSECSFQASRQSASQPGTSFIELVWSAGCVEYLRLAAMALTQLLVMEEFTQVSCFLGLHGK